jgi:hypothetical protein
MKEHEVNRFRTSVPIEDGVGMPAEVTPWEHREYFELF